MGWVGLAQSLSDALVVFVIAWQDHGTTAARLLPPSWDRSPGRGRQLKSSRSS